MSEPIIISASRSTDIPAFYAKWFFQRLKAGYCVWYNPFNHKPMRVSFDKCKAVIFWTKNPEPIIPYLDELNKKGIHYYFQFTLNNYEYEQFEPCVPKLEHRIETFKKLSQKIGKERVIWRFDPLIVTPNLPPQELLRRIENIGNKIENLTEKLVFSFADVKTYRKVQNNLIKVCPNIFNKENVATAEMTNNQRINFIEGLIKLRKKWADKGWNLTLATCAEDVDLQKYGIEHNRCIDSELLERISQDDIDFIYYLRTGKTFEGDLFNKHPSLPTPLPPEKLKDKGQRKLCGCMVSKDIGMYDTCRHFCVYCYANTSRDVVEKNKNKHNDDSESIID